MGSCLATDVFLCYVQCQMSTFHTDHIIHFDALKRLVPKLGEDELLNTLKHVAISVRGRLLVKSSLACRDAAAAKARNAILDEVR